VLYCLYKDGKTWHKAQFDLMGIASIQWQRVSGDGVLTLAVSDKKSFKTPRGDFYEITKKAVGEVDETTDEQARAFAGELTEVYASYDANAKYYAKASEENLKENQTTLDPKPVSQPVSHDEMTQEEIDEQLQGVPF
jgi:hypothetical protein